MCMECEVIRCDFVMEIFIDLVDIKWKFFMYRVLNVFEVYENILCCFRMKEDFVCVRFCNILECFEY